MWLISESVSNISGTKKHPLEGDWLNEFAGDLEVVPRDFSGME
jgi:hypothetical protein